MGAIRRKRRAYLEKHAIPLPFDPPASNYFDLFSLAPFIESSQCARKNFFSVGRNVFDGATIGRSVVVI